MILYFQAGKNKRLAIDTKKETYNTHYFYLGGHRQYLKVSATDYKTIIEEIEFNNWKYDENF